MSFSPSAKRIAFLVTAISVNIKIRAANMKSAKREVGVERHSRNCTVCRHPQRDAIENAFVAWQSPAAIAADYGLSDRLCIYRHAHALDLFVARKRNVRAALEKIIERAGEVDVTASAVVAAVQAYAKINTAGEWVDKTETVNLNDLFTRMSDQELDQYAKTGALPAWFRSTVGVTALEIGRGENVSE
jgi:hypothetical protein